MTATEVFVKEQIEKTKDQLDNEIRYMKTELAEAKEDREAQDERARPPPVIQAPELGPAQQRVADVEERRRGAQLRRLPRPERHHRCLAA